MNIKKIHRINEDEKTRLRNRIHHSIKKHAIESKRKRKKRSIYFSVAASVLFIFGISFFYEMKESRSYIEQYVEVNQTTAPIHNGEVKIVLNNQKIINLKEEAPSIVYTNNGETIRVNNEDIAHKDTISKKEVFNSIIVPYGKRSFITLSDGSKVWMNSGSKLTYLANFKEDKREVYLEGEAIFEVTHNKERPFYVVTKDNRVEVLGTVFNVSNYSDDDFTETTLKSGSVEIKYASNSLFGTSTTRITPGTMASYNRSTKEIHKKTVNVDEYMSWRDGFFIFHSESLTNILRKVSRYYNVKITVNETALKELKFSGSLDLRDTIEEVMELLKETSKFNYQKIDNQIIIN